MKITSLDKPTLRVISAAMEKALSAVGNELGIKITVGNARYEAERASYKIEVATVGTDGTVQSKGVVNFKKLAHMYGLKPEHLGAEITYGGKRYRITGLNPDRFKFPLEVKRIPDGKGFCLPEKAAAALKSKEDGGSFLDNQRLVDVTAFDFKLSARDEAEKKADALLRDAPENYYMDGELKGSAKQIREHWIQHFMKSAA
jgi:hypothetical protein